MLEDNASAISDSNRFLLSICGHHSEELIKQLAAHEGGFAFLTLPTRDTVNSDFVFSSSSSIIFA